MAGGEALGKDMKIIIPSCIIVRKTTAKNHSLLEILPHLLPATGGKSIFELWPYQITWCDSKHQSIVRRLWKAFSEPCVASLLQFPITDIYRKKTGWQRSLLLVTEGFMGYFMVPSCEFSFFLYLLPKSIFITIWKSISGLLAFR